MKKVLVISSVLFFASAGFASAHTATSTCESMTLSNAPANSTAVITPGNRTVPGNGTFTIAAGTYTITWSDNHVVHNTVVASCAASPTPTMSPVPSSSTSPVPTTSPLPTTSPTSTATPTPAPSKNGTIVVIQTVTNDNGGTKSAADFNLFVNDTKVQSGLYNDFDTPHAYTVTVDKDSKYTQTFSGGCNSQGQVDLQSNGTIFCIVSSDDIGSSANASVVPPLIDVVVVPSPFVLPLGPGPVAYTYTVENIGTVAVSNVGVIGDTCSPIVLVSGDTNANGILDVNESWTYNCSTTLQSTHTNNVVVTGSANGITAADTATSLVVIGEPVAPPLIHVTKVPNPLTLPIGGGLVTYTERVTNLGVVPVSNVNLVDSGCGPLLFVSGDTDGDSMLDTTETWTYTCQANLTATTTSTATVTGVANGILVSDLAVSQVIVSFPGFPSTGIHPDSIPGIVLAVGVLLFVAVSSALVLRKRTI